MMRTTARRSGPSIVLLAGALVLSACSDDADTPAGSTGVGETSAAAPGPEADERDADVAFAAGMVPHHRSAIAMAQLAETQDTEVLAMAESIRDSQSAEIAEMEQLLVELGG